MAYLLALSFLLVLVPCQQGSRAPFEVESQREHKIFIRSSSPLDPAKEILEKFGNGNEMNLTDMETLFKRVGLQVFNDNKTGSGPQAQVYHCLLLNVSAE